MKIRNKLLVSHGALAVCVAVICAFMLVALETTDRNRRRMADSYESLRQLNELSSDSNRMAEQISELLSIGLSNRREVTEVSRTLLARLEGVRDRLREDIATAASDRARQRDAEMLEWIEVILDRTERLADIGARMADLVADGRIEEARRIYVVQVEDGLDDEISDLLRSATAADEARVLDAIDRWDRQTELLRALAISTVVLGTGLAVGAALVMDRLVSRPIEALARAVDDLGQGRVTRPRPAPGGDELGRLATRFDQMARAIARQQSDLRAARDSLMVQVAERTASLSQRTSQLEAANARLTRLNDTRTQFFADVSHELRTPLTAIRGQAEVALRQPQATVADLRQTLSQITRRSGQMGRLVDDLLFLARSEAGAIAFAFRDTMMQEVLAEVMMDAALLTRQRDVTISVTQPSEPIVLRADPDRLRQAIVIVLDNAISHAPDGTAVTLELDEAGGLIRLAVSDRGPGFTEEEASRVFERFYRGHSRGARGGAGLGLPIARWLLEQHGGAIAIARTEPGARVEITLPWGGAQGGAAWTS
ncbi:MULTISPECIES: ATP-binding protein [Paracoccus]|mgnify:CR=1 FL=1|uniref:sensor histidine kinase n=1 Tax=Paracoccus TaxID=265 RepID=UPI00086C2A44|nr:MULTISPECIES: ATP-binding protein [Paracoccus]ODT58331.1 MAG: hypothetical protein ABS73_13540 [Paracoccus sp. SCN 68-21]